jgi:hypothetical protein
MTDHSAPPGEPEPTIDLKTLMGVGREMRRESEAVLSEPLPDDMAKLLRELPESLRVTPLMKSYESQLPWHQRLLFKLLIEHSRLFRTEKRLPFRLWFLLWMLRWSDKKRAWRNT